MVTEYRESLAVIHPKSPLPGSEVFKDRDGTPFRAVSPRPTQGLAQGEKTLITDCESTEGTNSPEVLTLNSSGDPYHSGTQLSGTASPESLLSASVTIKIVAMARLTSLISTHKVL